MTDFHDAGFKNTQKTKILLTFDIIIELLLNRQGRTENIEILVKNVDIFKVYVSTLTLEKIIYYDRRFNNDKDLGNKTVSDIEEVLKINRIDITQHMMLEARKYPLDYEDALDLVCAKLVNADVIITFNPDKFGKTDILTWDIKELLHYSFITQESTNRKKWPIRQYFGDMIKEIKNRRAK